MYSNKSTLSLFFVLCVLLLSSCGSVKNIAYFQKIDSAADSARMHKLSSDFYDARIKPKDLLSITVVSTQPEVSKIFNLITPQISDLTSTSNNITSIPTLQTYLVTNDGTINFPVVGVLKVSNLTREEMKTLIQGKIASSFNNEQPIITIRIINYAINVVGEVMRPGKYNTINERMTIFEGIAMAGDLTIFGKRENVKVLRENADGSKKYISINLNDKNIIYSPAYYLEQNDVVYVEPNGAKSRTSRIGTQETLAISALSVLLSLTSIIVNVLHK